MARDTYACIRTYMNPDDVEEFFYFKHQTHLFAELSNVKSCVLDTYYPNFEDADDEYYESDDFSSFLLIPLVFGLI